MVTQYKTGRWKPPSILPIEERNVEVMSCDELSAGISELEKLKMTAKLLPEKLTVIDNWLTAAKTKLISCSDLLKMPDVGNTPFPVSAVQTPLNIAAITPPIVTSKSNYLKPVIIGLSIIAATLILKKILK